VSLEADSRASAAAHMFPEGPLYVEEARAPDRFSSASHYASDEERVQFPATTVFLGISMLLPWNVILTSADFFARLFGDKFLATGVFFYQVVSLTILILQVVWLGQVLSAKTRAITAYVIFVTSLVLMLVLTYLLDPEGPAPAGQEWLWYIVFVFMGAAGSLMNGSMFEIVAPLGRQYIGRLMIGRGIVGLLAGGSKAILKAAVVPSEAGLQWQSMAYFGGAMLVELAAGCVFMLSLRSPRVRLAALVLAPPGSARGALSVVKEIMPGPLAIMLVIAVTLNVFPALVVQIRPSSGINFEWFTLILTLTFFAGDIAGCYLTSSRCASLTKRNAITGSLARLVLPALIGVQAYASLPWLPGAVSDSWAVVLVVLLSVSNGYFSTMAMICASEAVADHKRGHAGLVMTVFLVVGLVIGTSTGVLWPSCTNSWAAAVA